MSQGFNIPEIQIVEPSDMIENHGKLGAAIFKLIVIQLQAGKMSDVSDGIQREWFGHDGSLPQAAQGRKTIGKAGIKMNRRHDPIDIRDRIGAA